MVQIIVIATIIFVLKKILDRQLTDAALKKLEVLDFSRIEGNASN